MLAKQPFRVEGNKAYGLGIADDKQGIAVILHALTVLKSLGFRDYGTVTVLVNGDEEISSPGSRALIQKLAAEHDFVLSHEGASIQEDKLSLATAGIGSVNLHVKGRASHAGSSPEQGINALYELSHQVLQMRDLSDPATGLKMNWTISQAGTNRNVIPADATATADVRVVKVADFERIEKAVQERIQKRLVTDAKVEAQFERRRPPLESNPGSLALARHAQEVYMELGRKLGADDKVAGGGTDAAFAGLSGKAGVVERFGLQGFGAHSADAEYVLIDSIEPRLYLVARVIIDISKGALKR
jgi:glutamate carboxypeptidase